MGANQPDRSDLTSQKSYKQYTSDRVKNRGGKVSRMIVRMSNGQRVNWPVSVVMALFHLGAVAALFMFSWHVFAAAVALYWLATGLGISMGYHRLLTHRSYKVPLLLEYFFAVCGTLALEGGPISWVATHRIHHQKSDRDGDPHSPREGGFWAHVGWLLFGEANHSNTRKMSKYAPDLATHRFYIWLNNHHWVPMIVLAVLLYAIGGFSVSVSQTPMEKGDGWLDSGLHERDHWGAGVLPNRVLARAGCAARTQRAIRQAVL